MKRRNYFSLLVVEWLIVIICFSGGGVLGASSSSSSSSPEEEAPETAGAAVTMMEGDDSHHQSQSPTTTRDDDVSSSSSYSSSSSSSFRDLFFFCLPEGFPCLSTAFCCDTSQLIPLVCSDFFCRKETSVVITPSPTTAVITNPPTSSPIAPPQPTPEPITFIACSVKDQPCTSDGDCCFGFLCNTWDDLDACYVGICAEEDEPCETRGDCCPTLYCQTTTRTITVTTTTPPKSPSSKGKKGSSSGGGDPTTITTTTTVTEGTCVCKKEGALFCNKFQPCCFGLTCLDDQCVVPQPTASPTALPTVSPTSAPTSAPTDSPVTPAPVTPAPTPNPTPSPTSSPTSPPIPSSSPTTPSPTTPSPTTPQALSPIFDLLSARDDTQVTVSLINSGTEVRAALQDPTTSQMVFAPVNDAVAPLVGDIPPGIEDTVLNLHVFDDVLTLADLLALPPGTTIQSRVDLAPATPVSNDGTTVTILTAPIIVADLQATNGIVHVIDGVLVPGADMAFIDGLLP